MLTITGTELITGFATADRRHSHEHLLTGMFPARKKKCYSNRYN